MAPLYNQIPSLSPSQAPIRCFILPLFWCPHTLPSSILSPCLCSPQTKQPCPTTQIYTLIFISGLLHGTCTQVDNPLPPPLQKDRRILLVDQSVGSWLVPRACCTGSCARLTGLAAGVIHSKTYSNFSRGNKIKFTIKYYLDHVTVFWLTLSICF